MMKILVATLLVYALGLLFTAVGSRLAGRCTTWCCALLGLPMWVVGGTVAPFCLALPQLMLAFLAAGMSVTALAVGTALAGGAQALLYSATTLANLTGTIQALWAATLISFGFCIPLLVEALNHPLGSVWKWFSVRCRYYPPDSLPIQLLNSAILNLTLALPISSLMYRHKLPVGAQFRSYEVPVCAAMALVLLLPPLCRHKLKRGQGWMCLALYFAYLAAALLLPRAGA